MLLQVFSGHEPATRHTPFIAKGIAENEGGVLGPATGTPVTNQRHGMPAVFKGSLVAEEGTAGNRPGGRPADPDNDRLFPVKGFHDAFQEMGIVRPKPLGDDIPMLPGGLDGLIPRFDFLNAPPEGIRDQSVRGHPVGLQGADDFIEVVPVIDRDIRMQLAGCPDEKLLGKRHSLPALAGFLQFESADHGKNAATRAQALVLGMEVVLNIQRTQVHFPAEDHCLRAHGP